MIDILIPTYNRSQELSKNLELLKDDIIENKLEHAVKIIISNNASQDNTTKIVEYFKSSNKIIQLEYFEQIENIGLEKNAVFILSKATSEYVMFLGDDDFLPNGYLNYCNELIKTNNELGYIVPGLSSLKNNGEIIEGRIEKFDTKPLSKGYESILQYSHLGHQMSGILMKRKNLLKNYLNSLEYRNIYLFIYFITNRMNNYNGYYTPTYKILVSVDNSKDWSYNSIGLLNEVFKSYYPFINIFGQPKVSSLMVRFIQMHSYRVNFSKSIVTNYKAIISNVKTTKTFKLKLMILLLKEYLILKLKNSSRN